jgi:aldehyde:ferredoxin oxidoreductase
VERKRTAYFETLGWDERGISTENTLERLGLVELESAMSRLRK